MTLNKRIFTSSLICQSFFIEQLLNKMDVKMGLVLTDSQISQIKESGWRYVRPLKVKSSDYDRFVEIERDRKDGTVSKIVESSKYLSKNLVHATKMCDSSITPLNEPHFFIPFLEGISSLEPQVISIKRCDNKHVELSIFLLSKNKGKPRNPLLTIDYMTGDDGSIAAEQVLKLYHKVLEEGKQRIKDIIEGPQKIERISVVLLANMLGNVSKVIDALTKQSPTHRIQYISMDRDGREWQISKIENGRTQVGRATVIRNELTSANYKDDKLSIIGTSVYVRDLKLPELILSGMNEKPIEEVIDSPLLSGGGLVVSEARNSGGKPTMNGGTGKNKVRLSVKQDRLTLDQARDLAITILS